VPVGVLLGDAHGRLEYCNEAARRALAAQGMAGDPFGQPVEDLLALLPAASLAPASRPGGGGVWYLTGTETDSLRDARFAAEVSDALAGTLNLRRTLGRIVDLAVPGVSTWAAITLIDHDELRQVSRGGGVKGDDRTVAVKRLSDHDRRTLQHLTDGPPARTQVTEAASLVTLGAAPAAAAAILEDGPATILSEPLRAHGKALGFLAVLDRSPAAVDRTTLSALARRGAVAVSAARVYEERSTLASTLRAALLPRPLPTIEGITLGAVYRPAQEATEIGGDFYEFHPDGEGWSFTLGDVCGKGVEAAVLTGQVRQSMRTASLVAADPVSRLELLNSALLATDGTSFVTLVHGYMRPVDGGVAVCVAAGGHPPPLLRRAAGAVEEVNARGPIVGMLGDVTFYPVEMVLAPGETLLCYTDGVPDAKGPQGFLGTGAMADLLADCGDMRAQAIAERVLQTALEHLEGRPHDDMAILAVQVTPRS
jgi:sigma-B regulation protein RsbU (phosphoserine phosphatase)